MESHKHNDDLIKRKLDSIGVEPGELTFKKVHTNYLKAKRSSSKRWILFLLLSLFAIGSFTAWWFYNSNSQNKQLAVTDAISKTAIESISNDNKNSSTESSPENSGEHVSHNNTIKNNNNNASINDQTHTESAASANESNSLKENKKTNEESFKNEKVNSSNASPKTETKPVTASESKKSEKRNSDKKVSEVVSKNTSSKSINDPSAYSKSSKPSENKSLNNQSNQEKKSNPEEKQVKTIPSPNKEEKQISDAKQDKEAKELTDQTTEKDSTIALNNTDNKTITNDQNINTVDTVGKDPAKKVNDPKTNDLLTSAITPSNNTVEDKKHHFYLSTELVYYTISYQATPNSKAPTMYTQNNANFPKLFSDGNPKGTSKIISGAVSLGYSYKNSIGLNAGISYFSVENKINGKAFAQTKTQMVLDHYVYDSIMQIIDTVYKVGSTRNINVVNGDTVEAQDYLNNIKYISIPLNLSYKLKFNSKFGIEPSIGIQYCIPLSSYQLIAVKDNTFTYGKTKNFMSPRATFFDVAMKFNYNLNSNAALYIKPGYYFNNRSIYNVDYALDYRLKSLYFAFGLTLKIK